MEETQRGSTPVPDPTLLTTQQLERAIAGSREIVESEINGIDKIVALHQDILNKLPAQIAESAHHLRELTEERFKSVATQFAERDIRTEQTSRDSKVAVDAALQAAKEAVGEQNKSSALAIAKSESATTKQIDQIQTIIGATNDALNGKIEDIKERMASLENRLTADAAARTAGHQIGVDNRQRGADGWAVISAVGGLIVGALLVAAAFMAIHAGH
jgi:hypothetical protein